jgi:hypothetical protein
MIMLFLDRMGALFIPPGVEDHNEFYSKSESFLNELFGISENPAAPLSADYTGKERVMEHTFLLLLDFTSLFSLLAKHFFTRPCFHTLKILFCLVIVFTFSNLFC